MKRLSRLLCLTAALFLCVSILCVPVQARGDDPDYIVVIPGETMPPTTMPQATTATAQYDNYYASHPGNGLHRRWDYVNS